MTVAEYLIGFLAGKNVKTVFAYPGANVLRLYGLLCSSSIRVVLCRHEQGAVHAAAGYAKATGKTGVCLATSGPGATNLITGIADAYLDSAPVLIITGQVPSGVIGRDAFQEADIMGITLPVSKHNYMLRHSCEIPRALEEAWRIAKTPRCGPVPVDITSDLFDCQLTDEDMSFECLLPRERFNRYPVGEAIDDIKAALKLCHRPLLLAGGGIVAAAASKALARLAQATGIPVVCTMMGKGAAEPDGFLGMAGVHGTDAANSAMSQCDLLIAVGCRFSDRTVTDFKAFGRSRTIIHCDIDPAELNKNIKADIPVICDANIFLNTLREACADIGRFDKWVTDSTVPESTEPIKSVAGYIAKHPSSCLITDVGTTQTQAAREAETVRERGFITSGGLGAMGFGLPAAIGTAFAYSDCKKISDDTRIVLICGDGGFQMTLQELDLLHSCPVPVKIIVVNNRSLEMVRTLPAGKGGFYALPATPDFTVLAAAYGIKAYSAAQDETAKIAAGFLSEKESGLLEIKAYN